MLQNHKNTTFKLAGISLIVVVAAWFSQWSEPTSPKVPPPSVALAPGADEGDELSPLSDLQTRGLAQSIEESIAAGLPIEDSPSRTIEERPTEGQGRLRVKVLDSVNLKPLTQYELSLASASDPQVRLFAVTPQNLERLQVPAGDYIGVLFHPGYDLQSVDTFTVKKEETTNLGVIHVARGSARVTVRVFAPTALLANVQSIDLHAAGRWPGRCCESAHEANEQLSAKFHAAEKTRDAATATVRRRAAGVDGSGEVNKNGVVDENAVDEEIAVMWEKFHLTDGHCTACGYGTTFSRQTYEPGKSATFENLSSGPVQLIVRDASDSILAIDRIELEPQELRQVTLEISVKDVEIRLVDANDEPFDGLWAEGVELFVAPIQFNIYSDDIVVAVAEIAPAMQLGEEFTGGDFPAGSSAGSQPSGNSEVSKNPLRALWPKALTTPAGINPSRTRVSRIKPGVYLISKIPASSNAALIACGPFANLSATPFVIENQNEVVTINMDIRCGLSTRQFMSGPKVNGCAGCHGF